MARNKNKNKQGNNVGKETISPEDIGELTETYAVENIGTNVEGTEVDTPISTEGGIEQIDTPADEANVVDEENTNPEIDAPADVVESENNVQDSDVIPTDDTNAPVEPTIEPASDLPEENIEKQLPTATVLTGEGTLEPEAELAFNRQVIVDTIVYGEDELTIVRTLLKAAKAKFKESNIITRLLDTVEMYLVTPASASKGGALVQTYAIEFNRAEKGDLTNLAIFMLSKLTGKETEKRGLKSLSLASIVNTTRLVEDREVKQESLKLVDALAELHSAEERKKKVNVLISLNKAFNVNPRYLNANAVEIFREYFSK